MAKKDALDQLAEGDAKKVISLLLWKQRFNNPDMAVHITEADITGFEDSCRYLNVTPDVAIVRPQGRPAQEAIPAQGKQRAVPGRAAEPARPYVYVGVVAKGTMDQLKPIENNEADADKRDTANMVRTAKEKAPALATMLLSAAQTGTYSTSDLVDAANALNVLCRA